MKSVFEIGDKYGRLTIQEYAGKAKNGSTLVKCICDCGTEKIVRLYSLQKGEIKSCGCLAKELLIKRNKTIKYTTHGQSRTRLYTIWCDMKQRCLNKNREVFKHYGERKISICDEWKNNFNSFYDWAMANGYKNGLSIERIDINDGYSPKNCKWIPKSEQSKNTCRTHFVTHNGKTQCVEDWCKELGIKSNTILGRARTLNGDYYKALFEYKHYQKNEKQFCPHGHEYTDENSGFTSQGYRYCKICMKKRREQYNKKRKVK